MPETRASNPDTASQALFIANMPGWHMGSFEWGVWAGR